MTPNTSCHSKSTVSRMIPPITVNTNINMKRFDASILLPPLVLLALSLSLFWSHCFVVVVTSISLPRPKLAAHVGACTIATTVITTTTNSEARGMHTESCRTLDSPKRTKPR